MRSELRIVFLTGALLLGAATALAILPQAFPHIQTTITRVGLILEKLSDPLNPPRLVVLGNSVAMSGIDSYQLATELGEPGQRSYNLSYAGQRLIESFLLQQIFGDTVEILVQMVQIEPGQKRFLLEGQKYNNLYMWGYRPKPTTIEILHKIYGSPVSSLLEAGDLFQRFASRWALQQWIDLKARRIRSGSEATHRQIQSNLTFPVPFSSPVPEAIRNPMIKRRVGRYMGESYQLDSRAKQLLEAMVVEAKNSGIHLAFVFAPMHPKVRGMLLKDDLVAFAAYAESLAINEHVSVIDATHMLSAKDFRDDIHPTISGARRLTSVIADSLGNSR